LVRTLGIVLVVDDDPLVRIVISECLIDAGFTVDAHALGTSALRSLADRQKDFHAVVTDVDLGERVDGWDVGRAARSHRPEIMVVYISGGAASGALWHSMGVEQSTFLQKPFDIACLTDLLAAPIVQQAIAS